MKKEFIFLLFLVVIIVNACTINKPEQITCEKPYISAAGSCCLDQNDNGVCDSGENNVVEELESSTASNGAVEVICPNIRFNLNEASREIEFEVKQVATGSTNYAPTLKCDESYKSLTLQRFILNQGESQKFKNTVYPSNSECEFGVIETANTERAVYCKTKILK